MRPTLLFVVVVAGSILLAPAATATPIPDSSPPKTTSYLDSYFQFGALVWTETKGGIA